jgi:hypothetical protein
VPNFPADDPIYFNKFTVVKFSTPESGMHIWPIFMSSRSDWVSTGTTCFAWGGWKRGHDWWLSRHSFSVINLRHIDILRFPSRRIVFPSCCTLAGYWLELPLAP